MLHKKSLGQHFLRDPRILQKIIAAAELTPADTVLEVGPGEGTLTSLLLQCAGRVIAVEKDDRLIPVLQQKFAAEIASGKLALIHADILALDVKDKACPPTGRRGLRIKDWKIVANLPYYITGQFLRKFLQTERQPRSMTLLLQKEVAKRIVASDRKESVLSISVKCYGTPRYIATVKAGSFSPPPKVDSAILSISNISKDFFKTHNTQSPSPPFLRGRTKEGVEKEFFSILKQGFTHPRKLLSSNLGIPPETLEAYGIPKTARAENLSLAQWQCLSTHLQYS